MVQIHSPRPFISGQTLAAISKTGSDLVFGPFGPTTTFVDGSSKPKPILSATSLRNATSCRILSYRSDIPSPA
jgi:hypothetical protein